MSHIPFGKVVEVENFFPEPYVARAEALRHPSWDCENHPEGGNWPGKRTDYASVISHDVWQSACESIYRALGWEANRSVHFDSYFQICDETDGDSWVHQDDMPQAYTHVGLVYLTPDAPRDGGTLIYKPKDPNADITLLKHKNGGFLPGDPSEYTVTHEVENVFNKGIIYNPLTLHKSNKYFGQAPHNARATYIFFARDNEPERQ